MDVFLGQFVRQIRAKINVYGVFVIGSALYLSVSGSAMAGNKMLFVGTLCLILSMYGGAFATVPAYLADLFGTQMVGAIHGRLLTAWATAGILGPVIVNYMRDYQLGLGIPREQVYNQTMWILAGLLIAGLICNLLIRPVDEKWFMNAKELKHEEHLAQDKIHDEEVSANETDDIATSTPLALVFVAWLVVGIPLAWGIYKTLMNVGKFFV